MKMSEAFHQLYVAINLPRELSSGPWISIYMQLRTRKENFREGTALRRVLNDLVWEALTWEARTNAKGKCLLWVDDAVLRPCYSGDGHTAQLRHIFQLECGCSSAISPTEDVLFEAYSIRMDLVVDLNVDFIVIWLVSVCWYERYSFDRKINRFFSFEILQFEMKMTQSNSMQLITSQLSPLHIASHVFSINKLVHQISLFPHDSFYFIGVHFVRSRLPRDWIGYNFNSNY